MLWGLVVPSMMYERSRGVWVSCQVYVFRGHWTCPWCLVLAGQSRTQNLIPDLESDLSPELVPDVVPDLVPNLAPDLATVLVPDLVPDL